ncbi:MAG: GNAT family N-acetyltransferase [Alphaproteobacteria bacterium]
MNVISYLETDRLSTRHQSCTDLNVHMSINIRRWANIFDQMAKKNDQREKMIGAYTDKPENMAGFIWYGPERKKGDIGEIMALYVLPQYWRAGIGTKLFNRAVTDLKNSEFSAVKIYTDGNDPIPNEFYRKMGAKPLSGIFNGYGSSSTHVSYLLGLEPQTMPLPQ